MQEIADLNINLHDLEQAEFCVCFNLRSVSRAVTQFYNAALQPSGLLATQFPLLAFLGASESPVSISVLANKLSMDRTTLARNLQPLQREQLVQVVVDEQDHRVQLVSITATGLQKLAIALPLWNQAQQHVMNQFGLDRWQRLLGDLGSISKSVQA